MSKAIILGLDGACPKIIEEKIKSGLLPNFKRLSELGCKADNLPYPSAVTPGNWTSIATGAKPWTHGISDFTMHAVGTPLDERYGVFKNTTNNRAQFVWDAFSDRGLKTSTIAFPGSLPRNSENHFAIGCSGEPVENGAPWTIAPSRALVAGEVDAGGPYKWNEHETVDLKPINRRINEINFVAFYELSFSVKAVNTGYEGQHSFTLLLGKFAEQDGLVLQSEMGTILLHKREWSPFLGRTFSRNSEIISKNAGNITDSDFTIGEFRIRLIECDIETGKMLLYISTVYPKYNYSSNTSIAKSLRESLGPYNDNLVISRLLMGWLDPQGFYDEFRLQGIWEAKAAVKLINEYDYSLVFTKWHAFDKFYHFFMHKIDPVAPEFDSYQFSYYENLHNMILRIADEMVGIVLDSLKDNTSFIVISDHGLMASRRCAWVNRYLAKHGYIAFKHDNQGRQIVDWSRTRAYVSSYLILNINLKGREPDGVVELGEDYNATKKELIKLLRQWYDEKTGEYIFSDVFDPSTDGLLYGLGSELDGDIRYFTTPGTTLYRSISPFGDELITDVKGPYLGDHGSCRPSAQYGRGSEIGMFYACGKGFKKGYIRKYPIRPDDIIPTLLHISGEKPLLNQEGAILHDMLLDD